VPRAGDPDALQNSQETIVIMPFVCSICGEESMRICALCTKDACNNHLCEKCGRCSDCCECEVALFEEPKSPSWGSARAAVRAAAEAKATEPASEPAPPEPGNNAEAIPQAVPPPAEPAPSPNPDPDPVPEEEPQPGPVEA
jgi:hypothetical protein